MIKQLYDSWAKHFVTELIPVIMKQLTDRNEENFNDFIKFLKSKLQGWFFS